MSRNLKDNNGDNMDKITKTYLNIIKEEAIPKAQLVNTKQESCKVGKITRYFYQNELGRFEVAYEPHGSEPPFKYIYIVSRVEVNKPIKEADTSLHYFNSLEEAVKYGEEQLVKFTQERYDYYNGLRDWVAARPNKVWLD